MLRQNRRRRLPATSSRWPGEHRSTVLRTEARVLAQSMLSDRARPCVSAGRGTVSRNEHSSSPLGMVRTTGSAANKPRNSTQLSAKSSSCRVMDTMLVGGQQPLEAIPRTVDRDAGCGRRAGFSSDRAGYCCGRLAVWLRLRRVRLRVRPHRYRRRHRAPPRPQTTAQPPAVAPRPPKHPRTRTTSG
jgi:hypothetical protein